MLISEFEFGEWMKTKQNNTKVPWFLLLPNFRECDDYVLPVYVGGWDVSTIWERDVRRVCSVEPTGDVGIGEGRLQMVICCSS